MYLACKDKNYKRNLIVIIFSHIKCVSYYIGILKIYKILMFFSIISIIFGNYYRTTKNL